MFNRCQNLGCRKIVILDRNLKYPVIYIAKLKQTMQPHQQNLKLCSECRKKVQEVVKQMNG